MNTRQLKKIKELYNKGENLMEYFRQSKNQSYNDTESVLISYDFQAGSYIKYTEEHADFNQKYTSGLAEIITQFCPSSVLEAGVGEATTLKNVIAKLSINDLNVYGFDLSWSRVRYAKQYCEDSPKNITLFTGDMFQMPIQDNSIDVVYTSHAIEPNGGRELEALKELYRVTRKYLILLEPCFELATEVAKQRMLHHGYVTKLQSTIEELGYKVIEFKLYEHNDNPLNPTGITILEKTDNLLPVIENPLACPNTLGALKEYESGFYAQESFLAYPKLDGVPCLLPENALIASHFEDFQT